MRRLLSHLLGVKTLALLAVAGSAAAAVTLSLTSPAVASFEVRGPPVVYQAGADAGVADYVAALSVSTNGTYVEFALRGVPEATVAIDDLFRIANQDVRARTVTLASSQVANAHVTAARLEFYDGAGTQVGLLDFKNATPGATLPILPPGQSYRATAVLTLASGAGNDNAAVTRAIRMTIGP